MSEEAVLDAKLLWRECELEIGWALLEEVVGEVVGEVVASLLLVSIEPESLDKDDFNSSSFVSSSSLPSDFLLAN